MIPALLIVRRAELGGESKSTSYTHRVQPHTVHDRHVIDKHNHQRVQLKAVQESIPNGRKQEIARHSVTERPIFRGAQRWGGGKRGGMILVDFLP